MAQAVSEKPKPKQASPAHVIIQSNEVKWTAPPAGMIQGTPAVEGGGELHYALLQGDPMKPGAGYTIRLGCTDGYKVAPHWHPGDENVVILKGSFGMATGDKFDPAALRELMSGTYGFMPRRVHHFGMCKGETDMLVYGIGPFVINYVGAAGAATKKSAAP